MPRRGCRRWPRRSRRRWRRSWWKRRADNDVPALAQADVGIAMSAAGTGAAIDVAHVALMQDDWRVVLEAIDIGQSVFRTIQ